MCEDYEIIVDHTVYHFLEYQRGVLSKPDINSTIRALLSLPEPRGQATPEAEASGFGPATADSGSDSKRTPRTQLSALKGAGLLREGEPLRLHDLAGKPTPHVATVSGKRLFYNGRTYSTSRLAADLLQVEAIRGPAYWRNATGESVMELWEKFLNKQ